MKGHDASAANWLEDSNKAIYVAKATELFS